MECVTRIHIEIRAGGMGRLRRHLQLERKNTKTREWHAPPRCEAERKGEVNPQALYIGRKQERIKEVEGQ